MQILAEVSFCDLRVGDRVKSKNTGREGFIRNLIDITEARRRDDNEIVIYWENGNVSYHWQYMYDNVWLM